MGNSDQNTAADRLLTLERVRVDLLLLNVNLAQMTLAEIEEQEDSLQEMKADVDRFVTQGDTEAFMVSKRIGDVQRVMREWKMLTKIKAVKRKKVFVKGNSTLRFLAEDELGTQRRWLDIAHFNKLNYSTDLLSVQTVDIP